MTPLPIVGPRRRLALLAGLALAVSTAACQRRPAPPPLPLPPSPAELAREALPATLALVRTAATEGDYRVADSALTAFRERFPETPSAAEALYWRGLLRLDPANPTGTTRDGLADLDAYRAGGGENPRRHDATVLHRLARQSDSLRAAIAYQRSAAANQPPPGVPRDSLRVRDEEILRLRADLEQTRTELERLRRRLAPPRP